MVLAIVAFFQQRALSECENNESPYCLQYVCPNGMPATRVNNKGETIESGSNQKVEPQNSVSSST